MSIEADKIITDILTKGFRHWDGGIYVFVMSADSVTDSFSHLDAFDKNQGKSVFHWEINEEETHREVLERVSWDFASYLVLKREASLAKIQDMVNRHQQHLLNHGFLSHTSEPEQALVP